MVQVFVYRSTSASSELGAMSYYYLYNAHGDVTSLIDTIGNVAVSYDYDAFGNILSQIGTADNHITYAGYQYDKESGLYYLNARYYDSVTARFISEDDPKYSKANDPLSLNLYTYCSNNPITYTDPSGHSPKDPDDGTTKKLEKEYRNSKNNQKKETTPKSKVTKTTKPSKSTTQVDNKKTSEGTDNTADAVNYITAPSGNVVEGPTYSSISSWAGFFLGLDSTLDGSVTHSINIIKGLTGNQQITQAVINYNKENTYEFNEKYKMGQATGAVILITFTLASLGKGTTSNAVAGAKGTSKTTGGLCFTEETLVKTADGHKQIGDIKVGDKVYSENVETGEKGYKTVKQIFINDAYTLLHIFVNDTEVKTTFPHPFYVIDKGWVEAKDLKVGDLLKLASGETTEVKALSVEKLKTTVKVYNFEVEDWHTYYVSGYDVLVHNTGSNPCAQLPDNAVVVRGGESKVGDLKANQGNDPVGNTLSANGGVGLTEKELSVGLKNGKITTTTVGELRAKGYDVVSSPTANNPNHVSIITPGGKVLTDTEAANLQSTFTVKPNPSK